ncbi:MAG: guanylate kinase [Acidobacteria bacterium]|nr:guanylate kinase [Acidobacteriota bacterium]
MTTVFIVSAPSGSGKSTLVSRLLARDPKIMFSVSYTTRAPRGAEVQGGNYHYISRELFEEMVAGGEFLEWAEVFGNCYGTHRSVLERARAEGKDLILDIDVQGARQLMERLPEAVSVFVLAPSRAVLEQRLRARSEDSEPVIRRRLQEAAEEIRNYRMYDYVLVNDHLDRAVELLAAIVSAERLRRNRVEAQVQSILATFEVSVPAKD